MHENEVFVDMIVLHVLNSKISMLECHHSWLLILRVLSLSQLVDNVKHDWDSPDIFAPVPMLRPKTHAQQLVPTKNPND